MRWSKRKTGINLQIPGFGNRVISTVVSDYDGTLSYGGNLQSGLKDQMIRLADLVDIHVLTADKRAKSPNHLGPLPLTIRILKEHDQDVQKRQYLDDFDVAHVAVLGNGHNDRLMFEAVRSGGGLCIAVENGEGCATDIITHAHVFIHDAQKALNLLLNPDVCAAALRF
jgi:soluble P-type ATPase